MRFSVVFVISLIAGASTGLYLTRTDNTYAQFPKWNACVNASFSFEFRTWDPNGLIFYTDDNGTYDFFEISMRNSSVRLRFNIVNGKEGGQNITLGNRLNDNRWHKVKIQRNRMETILMVDNLSDSRVAFGSDFYFGDIRNNSHVFFGGIPQAHKETDLRYLVLPSSIFELRFEGEIRNVIYGNCSCVPVRGEMMTGVSVSRDPAEICERRNPCGDKLCISNDNEAICQDIMCRAVTVTHYHLPMDQLMGRRVVNPSGLDSTIRGNAALVSGVLNSALEINGKMESLMISGPGHRDSCFGDLSLCPKGYTLGLWEKFRNVGNKRGVYMSNGGHTENSHGIAMTYKIGSLQFIFRMESGKEWKVTASNVLPNYWYHVLVTWHEDRGLLLYVNGNRAAKDVQPQRRSRANRRSSDEEFILGGIDTDGGKQNLGVIKVDEFHFWSEFKSAEEIRELAPIYQYHFPMDTLNGRRLDGKNLDAETVGNIGIVPGKVGNALYLSGDADYVDFGDFSNRCLGNTGLCGYGLSVSFWMILNQLRDNAYYFDSGPKGFSIYSRSNYLYCEVAEGNKVWKTRVSGIETGVWYFVEVSWTPDQGLLMFLDQNLKAMQSRPDVTVAADSQNGHFYIGRKSTDNEEAVFPFIVIDDVEMFYADRSRLIDIDFIQRGRPTKQYFGMDDLDGNQIQHPSIMIETYGSPKLVEGKIGAALRLNGNNQWVDLGEHQDTCLGNLDNCHHGITIAMWFYAHRLRSNTYFLSTGKNGITLYYHRRQLKVQAKTTSRTWETGTDEVEAQEWYFLEISWDPETGLELYLNNGLMGASSEYSVNSLSIPDDLMLARFYIGRGNIDMGAALYGDATFDELEYWYGPRHYLIAHGYIQRGDPTGYLIEMEQMDGKRLVHESLDAKVHGDATLIPGRIGKALKLGGRGQYLDLGQHSDICLGNLAKCPQGILISAWMRFDHFHDNMYFLSTGSNGVQMYYDDGYIYVTMNQGNKAWKTTLPHVKKGLWHFIELSWHPDFGLNVYLNNTHVGHSPMRNVQDLMSDGTDHFYVGQANPDDVLGLAARHANMAIDHLEIWYARREELLAFNEILRGIIQHESFSMETAINRVIEHPRFTVTLVNGGTLVPGKVGNAVRLDGNGDFVNIEGRQVSCFTDLTECNHGLTASLWVKANTLKEDTYILSNPAYSLYYKNKKLVAKFHESGKSWTVSTAKFKEDDWTQITLSWTREKGLSMYLGDELVDSASAMEEMQGDEAVLRGSSTITIGKEISTQDRSGSAHIEVDEFELWDSHINPLRASGEFGGPIPHEVISLSNLDVSGTTITEERRTVRLYGGISQSRGQYGNALLLNGNRQYLDLGENVTCGGNLLWCRQGFTMRFLIKPINLMNNMYFLDSFPLSLFYRDGRLYTIAKTATKSWTVSTPDFREGEWHVIDISWHPEIGLTMHLDSDRSAHQTRGKIHDTVRHWDRRTYIGRSLRELDTDRYARAIVERIEVWNTKRDRVPPRTGTTTTTTTTTVRTTTPERERWPPTTPYPHSRRQPGGDWACAESNVPNTTKVIRFFGSSYLHYNFANIPADGLEHSDYEELFFWFTTSNPDGLIWLTQFGSHTMHLSMKSGFMMFVVSDGRSRPQVFYIRPRDGRVLHDWSWHKFKFTRYGTKVEVFIDDERVVSDNLHSNVVLVTPGEVYLGGTPNTLEMTSDLVSKNFDGALVDVHYSKTPRKNLNVKICLIQYLSHAITHGPVQIVPWGDWSHSREPTTPAPPITKLQYPITFVTMESLIALGSLDLRSGGTITFRFKTNEPRSILLFSRGRANAADYMAIEIFDGILYFVYNFGSGNRRVPFAKFRVDNGEWHEVSVDISKQLIRLLLDERYSQDIRRTYEAPNLYFGSLFVGGVMDYNNLPWHIWSRNGFQGCMEDLQFKNIRINIHDALQRAFHQGVRRGCDASTMQCSSQPCRSGSCYNRMGGYYCDCSNTPYTGRDCSQDAVIIGMEGDQFGQLNFPNRRVTHTNDISFRFLTALRDGMLFWTECDENNNHIRAEMEGGRIKVTVHVDGEEKIFYTGDDLNDYRWHTLYIHRRGGDIKVWVDDDEGQRGTLRSENFYIDVDRLYVGSGSGVNSKNYIGYMQNFWFDDVNVFDRFQDGSDSTHNVLIFITDIGNLPKLTYHPVTIINSETFVQLPTLHIGVNTMRLFFKFRTTKPEGVILFNQGLNDFIAVELHNGLLRYAFDTGGKPQSINVNTPRKLDDNKWHNVWIQRVGSQHEVRVDNTTHTVSTSRGDGRFDLTGPLFIGGLPQEMFNRRLIKKVIKSKQGFIGCLASFDLNGAVPELMQHSQGSPYIHAGCKNIQHLCRPNSCINGGVCIPMTTGFWCDCNMTSMVGVNCTMEATGYYFGRQGNDGIIVYKFPYELQKSSEEDRIAFGFMTKKKNAILMRINSAEGGDFIEIKLENGHVIASYNTGNGRQVLKVSDAYFSDGNYHVVKFIRTSSNSSLSVDSFPVIYHTHRSHSVLNPVHTVMIGAHQDNRGAMINTFNGIIAGVYWNGLRILDLAEQNLHLVDEIGDVSVAPHPFILVKVTKPEVPEPDVLPPIGGPHIIPPDIGGGGVIGGPGSIGGESGGVVGDIVGIGQGGSGLAGGGGLVVPPEGPAVAALTGAAGAPPAAATGARAGAVLGSILGTMAFLSGLMWGLYRCKPGWCSCLKPGAGGPAAGASSVQISPPRAATNLSVVQAAGGGSAGGAGAGAGSGGAGAGGAGGGSSAYSAHYQSSAMSAQSGGAGGGGGAGGADAYDSATLRATGTFSNKGTVLGTPKSGRANLGSSSSAYSSSAVHTGKSSVFGSPGAMGAGAGAGAGGSKMTSYSYDSYSQSGGGGGGDYDQTGGMSSANYQANTLSAGSGGMNKYSTSTMASYNYQVQNMRTVTVNRSGQQMLGYAGSSSGAVTPGAAADEVRVDCCLITADGNSVVTGSSLGPPQVWDMHTGELLRIMKGDTVGSTSLHLTCSDRLLVGAVHSDLEINEYSSRKGVYNHKLQIWDFVSGKPLEMDQQEYCSALCTMSHPDKVMFGRSAKYGNATSIVIWDLMGNQPIKEMQYDAPVGNNDYINFLGLSKNDRYVVAGFTNSFDNSAEFVVFDMTLTSYNVLEPSLLRLDANPDCTVVLPQDEAVTGLRNGDLVVWSLRTGTPNRQLLMSNGGHAHNSEIKAVTLSENGKFLVSASADGTLKVWDMQSEQLQTVLVGHNDEVWCCAISPDNEIVVSGSRDGTIRLWRTKNGQEICLFKTGVDIFFVTMSHDKSTIVALGDKFGARKLIMLQVVRTKIRRQLSA
ncbi:hypothetical protein ScPMuIL_016919 [Solemya velum]